MKQVTTRVLDDLDGTEPATNVRFALDGSHYEIDLNEGNMARLMELLRPYVDNGRRSRKP